MRLARLTSLTIIMVFCIAIHARFRKRLPVEAVMDEIARSRRVVVLGSGAAGLTAALAAAQAGADVELFERAPTVGGTTALSGGACWIPNNRHTNGLHGEDSRERALEYLRSLSLGMIDDDLLVALVDTGPVVVDWLEATTTLRFTAVDGYPDYHPDRPGSLEHGGRTLDPGLFPFRDLGEWTDRVTPSGRLEQLMLSETGLGGGTGQLDPATLDDRRTRDLRGCGLSLVGHLLKACLDRDVVPQTGRRAVDLVKTDPGWEVLFEDGARALADAVVIATGGFEWNPNLVRAFLRGPMTAPVSMPTCTGDGLLMAMRNGAALGNMREAWWIPCSPVPGDRPYLVNRERTLPGSIMVNRDGRRFTNEAANYNAIGGAFHVLDPNAFRYVNLPAWLIFDHAYLRRYGFAQVPPGGSAPDWLVSADGLDTLAKAIDIDAAGLTETVADWNQNCLNLVDTRFRRGESRYDTWSGDAERRGEPASTLGPLSEPPFYAIEVRSGALGTRGGPRTTADAQVLDTYGAAIPGLYAAGNAMASPTGMVYGGGGGTLGPALTFGYLAGRHAARNRGPSEAQPGER